MCVRKKVGLGGRHEKNAPSAFGNNQNQIWLDYSPIMVGFPRTTSCVSFESAVLRHTNGNWGRLATVMVMMMVMMV